MPRELTKDENESLETSGILLRFAAQHIKDLPPSIVTTITTSLDAQAAKTWDSQTATQFWLAFNSLSILIQPVTLDSIKSNLETIPPPKWKFWRNHAICPSRRSAQRYLVLLLVLLALAVLLGFLASVQSKLGADVEKMIAQGDDVTEKLTAQRNLLEPLIGARKFAEVTDPEQQKAISAMQSEVAQQDNLLVQIFQRTQAMVRIGSLGIRRYDYQSGFTVPDDLKFVGDSIQNYYACRDQISKILLQKSIVNTIITSSILPIVLGLMGASAYVVRLISDQIKDSTFSSTSPVRHMVRVALGGLAGVVIGFAGVVAMGSLSPSALAFIAGYAVEPVFATFDSIAAKFRQ